MKVRSTTSSVYPNESVDPNSVFLRMLKLLNNYVSNEVPDMFNIFSVLVFSHK